VRVIPDPVQWYEGMLLMPQHFQQLAGRYESLIPWSVTQAGTSHPWGFIDLEHKIRDGIILNISRLKAVMPDGYAVESDNEGHSELELDLSKASEQIGATSFMVHLTVPKQFSLSTKGELARYVSYEGNAVADENSGDGAVAIPRLRPRLELWPGEHPPARLETLPLVRVRRKGTEEWETDEKFAPPFLRVTSDSELGDHCEAKLDLIRSKCHALSDQLRTLETGKIEEAMELRLKTHTLSVGIPPVEAALASGACHPFALYLLMCALAGQVAAVTSGAMSPKYPRYRHEDPLGSFAPVLAFLEEAVSTTATRWWEAIGFREIEGGFEAETAEKLKMLNEALQAGGTLERPTLAIGLDVPVGGSDNAVAGWGDSATIGGSSSMPELLAKRVSGASRKRVDRLPGLAPPPDTVLMAITLAPELVNAGDAIRIVRFSGEGRPSGATLFVRRDAAKVPVPGGGGR
jgi:type VI secretion system protein ImpJ